MRNVLWEVIQDTYNCYENRKYETLFTLANGYRGLRGSLEVSKLGEPGNFIAGVFDKSQAQVTEIVNQANPLVFQIYIEDELVDIDHCEILNYSRRLNMKEGVLYTELKLKTRKGKIIIIESQRFVSKSNVHRWAAKYTVKPINFNGKIFIENIIDGTLTNSSLDVMHMVKHFTVEEARDLETGIALKSRTLEKNIEILESTAIVATDCVKIKGRKYGRFGEKVREVYETFVYIGEEYVFYKYGTSYTARDTNENLLDSAVENLKSFINIGYENELKNHKEVWTGIWKDIDIQIDGDEEAQIGIRFNLFHLASSAYDGDERISIAAKGLHGEGYKGHVFWDTETFMLPFFIYTMPNVAKALLKYRYNTLEGARANAKLKGYVGAQFPWEAADDGTEVTPQWGFDYDGNPVRIWTGDEEYHINSDITFGIWEYYRATGDKDFIKNFGMEIFLDTAKFWQSRVEYNRVFDRYEINKVIGPDEFHEHVNNNVYTNYLAKWSIKKTLELVNWLKIEEADVYKTLIDKLNINEEDLGVWNEIQNKIYIPKSKDGKIIEQFEGYFDLAEIEITEHDENGMPLWPDLGGLSLGETKLIKQPDVVMLMLMLSEEFDDNTKKENYRYYEERTMHKSSLSPSMYSIMGLAVGDTQNSYKYFIKTIQTDIRDNQGNAEFGLHAASTGGSWQSAIFGFGGLRVDAEGILNLKPWIPSQWEAMKFNIKWRNATLTVKVTHNVIELNADAPIEVKVMGERYHINSQETVHIKVEEPTENISELVKNILV